MVNRTLVSKSTSSITKTSASKTTRWALHSDSNLYLMSFLRLIIKFKQIYLSQKIKRFRDLKTIKNAFLLMSLFVFKHCKSKFLNMKMVKKIHFLVRILPGKGTPFIIYVYILTIFWSSVQFPNPISDRLFYTSDQYSCMVLAGTTFL